MPPRRQLRRRATSPNPAADQPQPMPASPPAKPCTRQRTRASRSAKDVDPPLRTPTAPADHRSRPRRHERASSPVDNTDEEQEHERDIVSAVNVPPLLVPPASDEQTIFHRLQQTFQPLFTHPVVLTLYHTCLLNLHTRYRASLNNLRAGHNTSLVHLRVFYDTHLDDPHKLIPIAILVLLLTLLVFCPSLFPSYLFPFSTRRRPTLGFSPRLVVDIEEWARKAWAERMGLGRGGVE